MQGSLILGYIEGHCHRLYQVENNKANRSCASGTSLSHSIDVIGQILAAAKTSRQKR